MNILHSSCVKSSGSLWTNKSLSSSQWPDFTRKMSKSLSWETVRKNRCFPIENPFIVNHNQKRFIINGSIFHFKSVSFAGWISEEWVKLVCTHGFMNALDIWHSDSKTLFFLTHINHKYWAAQIPPLLECSATLVATQELRGVALISAASSCLPCANCLLRHAWKWSRGEMGKINIGH